MAKRKTADERRRDVAEAEAVVWRDFSAKLHAIESFPEAKALAHGAAPPQGAAGRKFYSNLAFFLADFSIPNGSNQAERRLYLEFVRRLDATGQLKAGSMQSIEKAILRSLER